MDEVRRDGVIGLAGIYKMWFEGTGDRGVKGERTRCEGEIIDMKGELARLKSG